MKRKQYTKQEVEIALSGCKSIAQFLRNMGLKVNNGNYRQAEKIVKDHGLLLPKFDYSNATSHLIVANKIPDELFFSDGVLRSGVSLKKRLIEDHGYENQCSNTGCVVRVEWLGLRLVLQVDHIDGNKFNNLVENLRFLCPNCHSQTSTFGNKPDSARYKYCLCGNRITKTSSRCTSCDASLRKTSGVDTKIEYPPTEDLIEMIEKSSFSAVSRELGISDNAIRGYLKRRGVDIASITRYAKPRIKLDAV